MKKIYQKTVLMKRSNMKIFMVYIGLIQFVKGLKIYVINLFCFI